MTLTETITAAKHKHSFENVWERLSTEKGRYLHIEICDECSTLKITYEGRKPKYVRK